MTKRLLSMLLAIIMIFSIVPTSVFATDPDKVDISIVYFDSANNQRVGTAISSIPVPKNATSAEVYEKSLLELPAGYEITATMVSSSNGNIVPVTIGNGVGYIAVAKKTYTVTYTDGVEGEDIFADQTSTVSHGDTYPNFSGSTPSRTGYSFEGWSPERGTITADVTYTAQWKANKYTVTYNDGKAAGTAFADQTHTVSYGDLTPAFEGTPTRPGYVFKGWDAAIAETVTGNVTYVAQWEASTEKYTVTYTDGEEGVIVFQDQINSEISYGETTPAFSGTLDAKGNPYRKGYIFTHWSPDFENKVTKTVTYEANWAVDKNNNGQPDADEDKLTVTYTDGVADEKVFEDQSYSGLVYGEATPNFLVNGKAENPTRDGYVFKWWTPGWSATVSEAVTYEAVWAEDKNGDGKADKDQLVTVTYKDGLGGIVFTAQVYKDLVPGTATPAFDGEPTRPGYTFEGWNAEIPETVTTTVTYTATWKEILYTATYTDGVDGKILFEDQIYKGLKYDGYTPKFKDKDGNAIDPTREGYMFTGWSPAFAEKVTDSVTYVATWELDENKNGQPDKDEDTLTITYTDGVEGEEVFADDIHSNLVYEIATPAFRNGNDKNEPTREGYVFGGWSPERKNWVKESVTYVATWHEDKNGNGQRDDWDYTYTVTYTDGANNTIFPAQKYEKVLSGMPTPEFDGEPTCDGYKFVGWDTANGEVAETVTCNIQYNARWVPMQSVNLVIYRNGNTTTPYATIALDPVAYGEALDVDSIDIEDYYTPDNDFEFDGFYTDYGWTQYKVKDNSFKLSGDLTITSSTNLNCMITDIYTVSVRAVINGDKANAQIIASEEFPHGSKRDASLNTLTIPEKTGYTLKKWFNWKNDNEFKNAAAVIEGHVEAYVTYDANAYTIKLKSGTGTTKTIKTAYDVDVTLENPFNKKGYTFKEWIDNSGDITITYEEDEVVRNLKENGGTVTLTALWTKLCEHGKLEELCGCCDGYHSYDEDYECVFCGEKCSHNKVTVKKVAATCTEPGHKQYKKCTECSWNNDNANKVIPATGHTGTYVAQGDATCTEDGTAIRTCRTCGDIDEKVIEGSATGHNYAEANCEEPQTCINCGETQAAALGHDFADATCEEPETCIHCGETRGEPEGHDEELVSLNKNKHQLQCSTCGEALGKKEKHTKVYFDLGDGTHQQECSECYEVLKSPVKHTYNTRGICKSCNAVKGVSCSHWDVTYTPSSRNGYHTETCADCGTNFGSVKCSDYDLDDDCDFCGETISASTNAYRYISNFLLFWL